MTTKFYITVLDVIPEYTDSLGNVRQEVFHRVWWTATSKSKEEDVFETSGHINLDISDLTNYKSAKNVSKKDLSDWALARMTDEQISEIEFNIE